jgi:hypothetical protein
MRSDVENTPFELASPCQGLASLAARITAVPEKCMAAVTCEETGERAAMQLQSGGFLSLELSKGFPASHTTTGLLPEPQFLLWIPHHMLLLL